ncbi:MAG TPA: GTPase HflX [Pseudothermotoga sp.]|nr:GTPase HflX [Pseudothermotoga sp.]
MSQSRKTLEPHNAIILSIREDYSSVEELKQLLSTLQVQVMEVFYQKRSEPDSRYYFGLGKIEKLKELIALTNADLVVVDDEITPLQVKNLEKELGVTVKDRTQIIIDIFADHATTEEGKLQVELASLQYQLPRLVGQGRELSRLGGGIGTRGPGEQELEEKRRRIRERIRIIKQKLMQIEKNRAQQRKMRLQSDLPMVSVVGYTNAGKSSLIKALSDDDILVADKLFSTLAPVIRRVKTPNGRVVLFKDTVGFIKNVPHTLIKAFESTLEEILYSNLIVVVVDISDENFNEKLGSSLAALEKLGANHLPRLLVFNKIDRVSPHVLKELSAAYPESIFISALHKTGFQELLKRVCDEIEKNECEDLFAVKLRDLPLLMKEKEKITITEQVYQEDMVVLRVRGRPGILRRLKQIAGGMNS